MSEVWDSYKQWVVKGGDNQIRTFATLTQVMMGYNGTLLEYVWKNELFGSAVGLIEHVNGEIRRTEEGERFNLYIAAVKTIRILQRAVEVALRMRLVGALHWPWETPLLVRKVIVAIELVKALLLLKVNSHLSHFLRTLRVYFRNLPTGRRTGLRVPLLAEQGAPALPPILTIWDVLQPLADMATVVRPLVYSGVLLLDHNKGRPWRALSVSLLLELCVFLVTFIKGKLDTAHHARMLRRRDQDVPSDVATSRKLSRQVSRFRDYLLRDPVYADYIQAKFGFLINFVEKVPIFGFFVESYLLKRNLYFETSGS